MASGSNSLIKGIIVLLFIGAVFFGLNFLLEEAPETTPIATTPSTESTDSADDPAVEEARQLGTEIGARVGEEIGRRVGALLVANLEAGEDTAVAQDEQPQEEAQEEAPAMVATAPEEPMETEADEEPESVEADPVEVAETEEESEAVEEVQVAEAESVADEPEEPSHTIADEPAIPAPVQPEEPDPSQKFVFSSSGWWTDSANGKGLQVVHVGQAVSIDGLKQSIVVILSTAFRGGQNLEQLIQVRDSNGGTVPGLWRRSANARNLYFNVPSPGSYQVSFSADLAGQEDTSLGLELAGPVSIE